jgi:ABC-type polysaccharide transport system permease subunit
MRNKKNGFYIALAVPGIIWLAVLFVVPVYAVLSIGMGKLNQMYEAPVAVWNPFSWSSSCGAICSAAPRSPARSRRAR